MTIEEGMYARTKSKIIKINQIIENGIRVFEDDYGREFEEETDERVIRYIDKSGWNCGISENEIIKASHNIIDLIEVGDYVNGKKVDEISLIEDTYYIKTKVSNTNNYDYLPGHLIETIVTKEQMESIEYKVK